MYKERGWEIGLIATRQENESYLRIGLQRNVSGERMKQIKYIEDKSTMTGIVLALNQIEGEDIGQLGHFFKVR